MCWRMDTPGCRLELIARCFPCIPNTWLHNWKLSEIYRWVYLVVLGILPTDARYEVWGSTLSEVVLWTCSDRELHLKGSLAMLIRGLQNPFVTRSMSFQHEDVERSFYLVFVLYDPCSFLFIFCSPSGFSTSWCTYRIHSFNPLFEWYCEDSVAYLSFVLVLILVFELLRCQMLIPYLS